ncbi:hypothetical protein P4H27_07860 [Paenibacillus taichungensis]|uniref:HAMP domain-containing protein n=1 Tax=Paenibacillus taichungensis TaxID=484184 RepID=UPI002DB5D0FA|nr:hypothetical protein [Paenibacillus taichungensis]MEC0106853.1 hypothetical protein [Paenibacillus taichungensis]MEC0195217.1 hypothetical protein [Paenibacillus taichungensis]
MRLLLRTVRLSYIYICGASALLSAALLFVVYHMLRFAHHHILSETTGITRIMYWVINHIGTTPLVIFIGGGMFALFFWIRSQKIADDLKVIGRGTHELAHGRIPAQIEVLNGGELRQIATDLNDVAIRIQSERLNSSDQEWIDREPRDEEWFSSGMYMYGEESSRQQIASESERSHKQRIQADWVGLQSGRINADLPMKLTLYGVRSSLETIVEGRCRDEAEIQHWVRLAYEQTLRLELALDSMEMKPQEHSGSNPHVFREPEC